MSNVFQNIHRRGGVRKVGREEGERFDVAGAHLVWRVKAEDSLFLLSQ
jgi:hypothetical protein